MLFKRKQILNYIVQPKKKCIEKIKKLHFIMMCSCGIFRKLSMNE
jgi:hypothetical protein